MEQCNRENVQLQVYLTSTLLNFFDAPPQTARKDLFAEDVIVGKY